MATEGLPPGPSRHPLRQSLAWIRRPRETVDECLRRYGDVFTLRMLGGVYVMHAEPTTIREILTQPPEVLAAGKANALLAPVVGSSSVLVLDGDDHMRMRRLQLPPFHGDRMRTYEHAMRRIAEGAIARWPLEEPFRAWPRLQAITLDIIVRVVFGIEDEARVQDVRGAVRRLLAAGADRRRFAFIGLRAAVTGRRIVEEDRVLRPVVEARRELGRLLEAEIARRRGADGGEEDRGDVLSLLLAARDDEGEPLPDALVRDQLITLLVAGHETTATSLAWAVERIARHPELQDRLAAEALDGRHELIDATVKETLRDRPTLAVFMRQALAPVEIGGRIYPTGTMVAGATLALHRNPEIYPEPDRFRPERFLGPDAPGTYAWTPFGGGIRRCLGASFALMEMRVILGVLLAERRLEPTEGAAEGTRRRSIVLAPERGAVVRAPRRRGIAAPAADRQRSEAP